MRALTSQRTRGPSCSVGLLSALLAFVIVLVSAAAISADDFAYSDKRCYGVTEAELGSRTPGLPPGSTLQKREVEAIADYLLANFIGRGPVTREECEEAFGRGARSCGEYPVKP